MFGGHVIRKCLGLEKLALGKRNCRRTEFAGKRKDLLMGFSVIVHSILLLGCLVAIGAYIQSLFILCIAIWHVYWPALGVGGFNFIFRPLGLRAQYQEPQEW
jgi:hypothetical protein